MNIDPSNDIITDPLGLHNTEHLLTLTPIGFTFITDQIEQSTTENKHKKILIKQLESNAKYTSKIIKEQLKNKRLKNKRLKEEQLKEEQLKKEQLKEEQLKEEQFKKQKIVLIKQLDINIENTTNNQNRSSYYIEFIKLYNELILVDSLNPLTFNKFETSIYKFKILFINLTDDERSITKYYYNKIIDKYSYYYKLFY